jgi:exonuclease SbcC
VRAHARHDHATRTLEQLGREQTAQEARHAELLSAWTALALHAEIEAVPLADREAWLLQRQEATRSRLQALAAQEAALRDNLQQRDAAQAALDASNQALAQARDHAARLQTDASALAQSLDAAQRNLAARTLALEQTLGLLDAAFAEPEWRARWLADPATYVSKCSSQALAWTQQQEARATHVRKLETLQVELSAAAAACARATQQLQTQTTACAAELQQLNALRSQREGLLQGRAVADVEQDLQAQIQRSRATLEAAQSTWQTAQSALQRLQEALRQADLQCGQLRTGLDAAQRALDDWLQSSQPLRPDTLDALLAIAPSWIATEREALYALHNAESAARAVLETRTLSLQQHEAARTTHESAADLQQALQQTTEEMSAATTALTALQLALALDDQRQQQSAALRTQIERQRAAANVWSQLGELIGSADGKKFRNFAQQLTLDILLGYGNRHLHHLTSRYRLERIQDSLGLLVVDQDMGDEIRSVHSLSGGESFLVSLAMALGLASLSSHRVRVESLFIDEGFGSLDADSLRVAMDALDRLQSLGRKVGVISHVQEMTERIGTRVHVQRQAGGLSRIVVTGA